MEEENKLIYFFLYCFLIFTIYLARIFNNLAIFDSLLAISVK
jgi:hypothetical protein